jgi:hypothetical protein
MDRQTIIIVLAIVIIILQVKTLYDLSPGAPAMVGRHSCPSGKTSVCDRKTGVCRCI